MVEENKEKIKWFLAYQDSLSQTLVAKINGITLIQNIHYNHQTGDVVSSNMVSIRSSSKHVAEFGIGLKEEVNTQRSGE